MQQRPLFGIAQRRGNRTGRRGIVENRRCSTQKLGRTKRKASRMPVRANSELEAAKMATCFSDGCGWEGGNAGKQCWRALFCMHAGAVFLVLVVVMA